jgi:hypothetical protein
MDGTVKLPAFGVQKKQTVYVVGGVVVVVMGVAYYRHKKSSAAATVTPGTTDNNAIDPATGFAYGSTEDAQATANNSAFQNPVDFGGGGGPPGSTPAPGTGFATNPQWEQAAVSFLTDTVGLSASGVSSALGKYLNGTGVNDSEKSVIEQAIAAEGQPPQSGANGYPPSIRSIATPSAATRTKLATPSLRQVAKDRTTATLSWSRVPNAVEYHVFLNGHQAALIAGGTFKEVVHHDGAWTVVAVPSSNQSHYAPSNGSNIIYVSGLPK